MRFERNQHSYATKILTMWWLYALVIILYRLRDDEPKTFIEADCVVV